jgi:hypothetical protein
MGGWNIGMMRKEKISNPIFQHSIIPSFQSLRGGKYD